MELVSARLQYLRLSIALQTKALADADMCEAEFNLHMHLPKGIYLRVMFGGGLGESGLHGVRLVTSEEAERESSDKAAFGLKKMICCQ